LLFIVCVDADAYGREDSQKRRRRNRRRRKHAGPLFSVPGCFCMNNGPRDTHFFNSEGTEKIGKKAERVGSGRDHEGQ
jgi:hypothetical protein